MFMLFLAGFALVNLRGMQEESATPAVADLLVTSGWRLDALGEARVPGDSDVVLRFKPDGTVSGFAGCNRFNSTYTLESGQLALGAIATTKRSCDGDANALESAFLEALREAVTVRRLGRRLALSDEHGESRLRFVAE